jgi:hypothetical protein
MPSPPSPRTCLFADLEARVASDERLSEDRRHLLGRLIRGARRDALDGSWLHKAAVVADLSAFAEAMAAGADVAGWRGIGTELNRISGRGRSNAEFRGRPGAVRRRRAGMWQRQTNNDVDEGNDDAA